MSNSSASGSKEAKAKRPIHPVLLGVLVFVVMCGAILLNSLREAAVSRLFHPAWYKDFEKGEEVAKNDKEAGLRIMEQAAQTSEKTTGDPVEKQHVFGTLANWYRWDDRYEESRAAYLKAVQYADAAKEMLEVSNMYAEMAILAHGHNVVGDAEANADKALQIKLKEIGPDHEWDGWVQGTVALTATDAAHYKKAEDAWKECIRLEKKFDRSNGRGLIEATNGLACTYAMSGQRALADKTFLDNIQAADRVLGVGNGATDSMICEYARVLKLSGDEKSAKILLTRVDDETPYLKNKPRFYQL